MLVDEGADTTTAVRISNIEGTAVFNGTPLVLADLRFISAKKIGEEEAIRRLLMKLEAVHAVSWLWASNLPCVTHDAAEGTGGATTATSTPLMLMLTTLRRRAVRPRVLVAALSRH